MKSFFLSSILLTSFLPAQLMPAQIPAADEAITTAQAQAVFKTLRAVNFDAQKVAFPIYTGPQRLAYGISIGEDRLLAKASEVIVDAAIYTVGKEKQSLGITVEGIYEDDDLVVLKVPGLKAPAAQWADAQDLAEGSFLTAIRPDGEAAAMGVLSVQERSLRTADQGFLGIQMDPLSAGDGVRVEAVVRGSAAHKADIRAGDIITMIKGTEVKGFYELSNRLRRLRSGETPEIKLRRETHDITVTPTLQGREISEPRSGRLDQMNRMSGTRSHVRGNFPNVLQSDMELEATDSGLPVVDLQGRIVGMVIAREGRISTLILPGDDIAKILEEKPQEIVIPQTANRGRPDDDGRRKGLQRELERMRLMMEQLEGQLNRE